MNPANVQSIVAVTQPLAGADSCSVPSIFVARHWPWITLASTTFVVNASVSVSVPPWQLRIWNAEWTVPW